MFKNAVTVPPPPPALLRKAVAAKEEYLGKGNEWTSVATNPRGETFCYGGFTSGRSQTTATLLFYDRHTRQWVDIEPGTFIESEDPKSVFKLATGKAVPSPDRGKFVQGATLRRLCGRYPASAIYIWCQQGKFPYGEGILQIKFRNYGLVRDEWASFGVLCNSLLNWRNLEGAPLYIDGKPADTLTRRHPELVRIANDTWRPHGGHLGPEANEPVPLAPPEVPGILPEAEDPKAFLKRMSREATHGTEYQFGFSIDTGDQYFIEDNARERGIEMNEQAWEQIGEASLHLEGNLLKMLGKLGIQTRAEGHSDNSLIGSAWVRVGEPGFDVLKRWVETDGESLHFENLEDCCPGASEQLWEGIAEPWRGVFMPRIDFFSYDEVPGLVEEGRKPKKPLGEDPKAFFKRMISTGELGRTQAYAKVLEYMPDDFVQAFQKKQHAEWHQDDFSWIDMWPSYDDDRADEGENPWSEVFYYFEYETDGGKIDLIVMEGDRDGNHDIVDGAEIGTPEAERLEKEYGADGWFEAMERYWQWVIEHSKDPLHYIRLPQVEVLSEWLAGFVKDGDRFRLQVVRQLTEQKPSPPLVSFEVAKEKAKTEPAWKELLDYCLVDDQGFTEATEEQIIAEGGKWDKLGLRLVLRVKFTNKEQQPNQEEFIRTQAQQALQHLRNPQH